MLMLMIKMKRKIRRNTIKTQLINPSSRTEMLSWYLIFLWRIPHRFLAQRNFKWVEKRVELRYLKNFKLFPSERQIRIQITSKLDGTARSPTSFKTTATLTEVCQFYLFSPKLSTNSEEFFNIKNLWAHCMAEISAMVAKAHFFELHKQIYISLSWQ